MKLNVRTLTKGLEFLGEVEGMRQHYYVLSDRSGPKQYYVMSNSRAKPGAGNFNLVPAAAVDQTHRRLRGRRGLTAKRVYGSARNKRAVPSRLVALNILYVLVAKGQATI